VGEGWQDGVGRGKVVGYMEKRGGWGLGTWFGSWLGDIDVKRKSLLKFKCAKLWTLVLMDGGRQEIEGIAWNIMMRQHVNIRTSHIQLLLIQRSLLGEFSCCKGNECVLPTLGFNWVSRSRDFGPKSAQVCCSQCYEARL
jgi:hypothetical protein